MDKCNHLDLSINLLSNVVEEKENWPTSDILVEIQVAIYVDIYFLLIGWLCTIKNPHDIKKPTWI